MKAVWLSVCLAPAAHVPGGGGTEGHLLASRLGRPRVFAKLPWPGRPRSSPAAAVSSLQEDVASHPRGASSARLGTVRRKRRPEVTVSGGRRDPPRGRGLRGGGASGGRASARALDGQSGSGGLTSRLRAGGMTKGADVSPWQPNSKQRAGEPAAHPDPRPGREPGAGSRGAAARAAGTPPDRLPVARGREGLPAPWPWF